MEDSPTQAEQLRQLLEEGGYTVTVAANGRQALAAARQDPPTLVISDIVMPEMDQVISEPFDLDAVAAAIAKTRARNAE